MIFLMTVFFKKALEFVLGYDLCNNVFSFPAFIFLLSKG